MQRHTRRSSSLNASRRRWGRVVVPVLAMVVIVVAAAYLALWSNWLSVQSVSVSGAANVPAAEIAAAAQQQAETRFGPLTSRGILVVSTSTLAEQLKQQFPDLATVEVKKRWPSSLQVTVTERRQALAWQSGSRWYLIDQTGMVYQESASQPAGVVTVVDGSGLPQEVGKQVAGAGFITVLDEIQKQMTTAGWPVSQFRIPETTFEVQAVTNRGWYVVFDTTRSIAAQVTALKTALGTEQPGSYADTRIPGRVYLK